MVNIEDMQSHTLHNYERKYQHSNENLYPKSRNELYTKIKTKNDISCIYTNEDKEK